MAARWQQNGSKVVAGTLWTLGGSTSGSKVVAMWWQRSRKDLVNLGGSTGGSKVVA